MAVTSLLPIDLGRTYPTPRTDDDNGETSSCNLKFQIRGFYVPKSDLKESVHPVSPGEGVGGGPAGGPRRRAPPGGPSSVRRSPLRPRAQTPRTTLRLMLRRSPIASNERPSA